MFMPGDFFKYEDTDVFIKKLYYIGDYIDPKPHFHKWNHNMEPQRKFHSFYYILEGEAMLCPGDKKIHVHPNEIVYIPAGYTYHSYGIRSPFCWIMFSFTGDIKPGLFSDKIHDESNYFKNIFEKINSKWSRKPYGYMLQIKSLIYSCLSDILSKNRQMKYSEAKRELIMKADKYIEANFTNPDFSVNSLIDYTGTSDTYFRETFKELHGMSPVKYINNLKIEKAKAYLKTTDISVNDIALSLGFLNVHYFSNVFKQIVGESPLKYRKSQDIFV